MFLTPLVLLANAPLWTAGTAVRRIWDARKDLKQPFFIANMRRV
jgi:hypothetical protein